MKKRKSKSLININMKVKKSKPIKKTVKLIKKKTKKTVIVEKTPIIEEIPNMLEVKKMDFKLEPWEEYSTDNRNKKPIEKIKVRKKRKNENTHTNEWISFHTNEDYLKLKTFISSKLKRIKAKYSKRLSKITIDNMTRNTSYKIYSFVRNSKLRIKDFDVTEL